MTNYTNVSMVKQIVKRKKTAKFPSRQVAFADDFNGVGSLEKLKKW